MLAAIDACLFDLDGTLLDTLEDLADAVNAVLRARGWAEHPLDAYRYFVGNGMQALLRHAAPEGTDAEALRSLGAGFIEEYAKNWASKTRPYPGIVLMLERLSALRVPFAVLSNKPHEFTQLTVRHFFPGIAFAAIQGSPKGGKAKPDPTLALGLARDIGVRPERVLFLGDSSVDMNTAKAAGMVPAGALWGFRTESELLEHGAKLLFESPEALFDHL